MRVILKIIEGLKRLFNRDKTVVCLVYGFFALVVVLPLFRTGYIFALDITTVTHYKFPQEITYGWLWLVIHWLLNLILPVTIIQKLTFFSILFLGGIGMHQLLGKLEVKWSKYFAGLLYTFNPFIYSRFLYGQLRPLMAYALFPWLVHVFLKFSRKPGWRAAISVGVWLALVGIINLHVLFISLILFFIVAVIRMCTLKNKHELFAFVGGIILIIIIFFTLSSYWLIPFVSQDTELALILPNFNQNDMMGFQTIADSELGVFWNTAAMYGFWGDKEGRYIVLKEFVSYWFWLYLLILVFVVLGVIASFSAWVKEGRWRKNGFFIRLLDRMFLRIKKKYPDRQIIRNEPWLVLSLIIGGVMSLILAVGIAHSWTAPVSWWLYDNLAFYKGLREPQKWVMVLILVYAYLGAIGIDEFLPRLEKVLRKIKLHFIIILIPGMILLIPLAYASGMFWGFSRQLCLGNYPESWYQLNDQLKNDHDNFKTLFFPWHMYMSLSFACNEIVSNPAVNFFDKPAIVGDNIEMGNMYSQSIKSESKLIEDFVGPGAKAINQPRFAEELKEINVKYIVLLKESDWQSYFWLDDLPELKITNETNEYRLYQNLLW